MLKEHKIAIVLAVIVALLAWAPWITDDYARNTVIQFLGGPNAHFVYLGQNMTINNIPIEISWMPFGKWVTFPGEAGWYVNFFGTVS